MHDFIKQYPELDFDKIAWSISGEHAFCSSMVPQRGKPLKDRYKNSNIKNISEDDVGIVVERLSRSVDIPKLSENELMVLLSPQANSYLEEIAFIAKRVTRQRFGNTISLYAPLYISNTCMSTCTYCGFSHENNIRRLTLTLDQIEVEAELLYKQGIRHLLLLTGESYKDTPMSYFSQIIERLQNRFSSISIEVYPLKEDEYAQLRQKGLDGLAVYQETYDSVRYKEIHLRGMKKKLQYRLQCPDRAGRVGIRKIAIGALAGLSDPATDVYFTALHARYLSLKYWESQISVSLPRLRPATGLSGEALSLISDHDYVRYLCVLRLFLPDTGLYLSTREPAKLRDAMAGICITHMSAGSKTEPGGYSEKDSDEQFEVSDKRSIEETARGIAQLGKEPLFVDWSLLLK